MKPRPRQATCRQLGVVLIAGALSCTSFSLGGDEASRGPESESREPLLSRIRQLSFEGRRSGEGYFDREGRRLVFQSEREPGNPFYQIYQLEFASGSVRRVSPGIGKTTCAWFHPSGEEILFASTHLDPEAEAKQERELAERASGRERRYSWDYDPSYDLFVVPSAGGESQSLVPALGYDAEGSFSPDGKRVLFASNRHAYAAGALDDEQRAHLERDPSYFIDLYLADLASGELQRLTESPGYDGGPFFSPDGERVVWRRFSEDGTRAEIHSMRLDGSDPQVLTRLGALSWAPFFHPSGDYLIFSTNLHGFDDFELYLVDAAGRSEPVRVTQTPGFDSLPVFAPDGKGLAFTSHRGDRRSQLFLADWNDGAARRALGLPAASPEPAPRATARTGPGIDVREIRVHVEALTDPASEGRLTGTPGERAAASYLAKAFRSAGLAPAGDIGAAGEIGEEHEESRYFQHFDFTAGVSLGPDNRLLEGSRKLELDQDWRPLAFSRNGEIAASEVVFAGYGIVAPAEEDRPAIDDYAGLDVRDRWVLVLRYAPPERERELRRYAQLRRKAMLARDRGARGLLVASGPRSRVRSELVRLAFDASLAGTSVAAISLSDRAADSLLEASGSGRDLESLQQALDSGETSQGFLLEAVRLSANVDLVQERSTGRNVVARLAGEDSEAPAIVVGAHFDHLGRGVGTSSLARDDERNLIHSGADDNASGVAALLEIAQELAGEVRTGGRRLARDLLFVAWSGEELGLLGSSHFTSALGNPHDPHFELSSRVAAYLNLDMVGRLRDRLFVYGVGSSPAWPGLLERANAPLGLSIGAREDGTLPTDSTPFYLKGVPVLSAFTGVHEDYHTPRDTTDKLNFDGIADTAQLLSRIAAELGASQSAPSYVAAPRSAESLPRVSLRAYLGTIPDYAFSGPGVRLSGLVSGAPAEQAGLRDGDVVVQLGGRRIENVYDYTYAIEALSIGEEVEAVVLRDDERVTLLVTPESRD